MPPSFALILIFAASCFVHGQSTKPVREAKTVSPDLSSTLPRSSPAYAEILLRKTDFEAELESLVLEYTEEFPKVLELRFSVALLQKETERLLAVKPGEASKLTLALGKLIVRRVELETDLWKLQKNYKDEHPEVKRAKRKVEIYSKAINEILG